MKTDMSEAVLESIICRALTEVLSKSSDREHIGEAPPLYGTHGGMYGKIKDYDREYCVNLTSTEPKHTISQQKLQKRLIWRRISPSGKSLARLEG